MATESTAGLPVSRETGTPVAREGATPQQLADDLVESIPEHPTSKDWVLLGRSFAEAIESRDRARDASAVEVERVLVEALKPFAVAEAEPNRCGCCHWLLEKCIDENCRGFHARRALARVASLRGGTGR